MGVVDNNLEQNSFVIENPTLRNGNAIDLDSNGYRMPAYVSVKDGNNNTIPGTINNYLTNTIEHDNLISLIPVTNPFINVANPFLSSMFGIHVIDNRFGVEQLRIVKSVCNMPKLDVMDVSDMRLWSCDGIASGFITNGIGDCLNVFLNGNRIDYVNMVDHGNDRHLLYTADDVMANSQYPEDFVEAVFSNLSYQYVTFDPGPMRLVATDGYGEDVDITVDDTSYINNVVVDCGGGQKKLRVALNHGNSNVTVKAFGHSNSDIVDNEVNEAWVDVQTNRTFTQYCTATIGMTYVTNEHPHVVVNDYMDSDPDKKVNSFGYVCTHNTDDGNVLRCEYRRFTIHGDLVQRIRLGLQQMQHLNNNGLRIAYNIPGYGSIDFGTNVGNDYDLFKKILYMCIAGYKFQNVQTAYQQNDDYDIKEIDNGDGIRTVYVFKKSVSSGYTYVGQDDVILSTENDDGTISETRYRFNIETNAMSVWTTINDFIMTLGDNMLGHPQNNIGNLFAIKRLFGGTAPSNEISAEPNLYPTTVNGTHEIDENDILNKLSLRNVNFNCNNLYDSVFIVAYKNDSRIGMVVYEYTHKISLHLPTVRYRSGLTDGYYFDCGSRTDMQSTYFHRYPFTVMLVNSDGNEIERADVDPSVSAYDDNYGYVIPFTTSYDASYTCNVLDYANTYYKNINILNE